MKTLGNRFQGDQDKPGDELQAIRDKFSHFRSLLDKNTQVLEIISDMEEKSHGDYLFDLNYIQSCVADLRVGMSGLIESMIALGGGARNCIPEAIRLSA
ncbi:MAG: hypothetical protein U9R56_04575 [candidate division Zixibacteria bacterium]|nr:hypothetical protein [candidate division Zixibacteria bacterium]